MKIQTTQTPLIKQGWLRALLYFICISVITYVFTISASYFINQSPAGTEKGDENVLQFGLMYSLMGLLIFLFTWIFRKKIDRRSFESLGFTWKGYNIEAGLGLFTALAILGIGSVVLVSAGYLSFTGSEFDSLPLLVEVLIMIVVAFVEELLFRGYLLNNLLQSMNRWVALIISAALFSFFHGSNPDVTVFAIINIFLAGILLGLNYIFTQNLWFSIIFHFAWNYFQGPVLGYDVSGLKLTTLLQQSVTGPQLWTGGLFGFEGSLLCPLLILAAIIVFFFAFARRYKPVS
jgi:membrane protease YdiL (CAAX protease family)